jgi:hypothetical protein
MRTPIRDESFLGLLFLVLDLLYVCFPEFVLSKEGGDTVKSRKAEMDPPFEDGAWGKHVSHLHGGHFFLPYSHASRISPLLLGDIAA